MKNNKFGVITVVLTVIGLVIMVADILIPIWRDKKELSVQLVASSRFSDRLPDSAKKRIRILVDGKLADDFSILQFRIANTGRAPIHGSDFDGQPLRLEFSGIERIDYLSLVSSEPSGLKPPLGHDESSICIGPFGLNQLSSYIIEIGALHKRGQLPEFVLLGQILGGKALLHASFEPGGTVYKLSTIIPVLLLWLLLLTMSIIGRSYLKSQVNYEIRFVPGTARLLKWMIDHEKDFKFFSAKFLRETVFKADKEIQEALQFGIDIGLLETYKVHNTKNRNFPTTAVRIDRDHPMFNAILTKRS